MLIHAQFFHNLGRKISHEIFVKIENTVYLSNQLTYAIFDLVMMFPIKNWTFEQILVFSISEMYLPCPTPTVNTVPTVIWIFLLWYVGSISSRYVVGSLKCIFFAYDSYGQHDT